MRALTTARTALKAIPADATPTEAQRKAVVGPLVPGTDYGFSNLFADVAGGSSDAFLASNMPEPPAFCVAANPAVRFYATDFKGSVVLTLDANGRACKLRSFEPFGTEQATAAPPNPAANDADDLRYLGARRDPSGLYHLGARYYDAAFGRFLQPDPLVGDPQNPQDYNRYAYGRNNPVRYFDPTGLTVIRSNFNRAFDDAFFRRGFDNSFFPYGGSVLSGSGGSRFDWTNYDFGIGHRSFGRGSSWGSGSLFGGAAAASAAPWVLPQHSRPPLRLVPRPAPTGRSAFSRWGPRIGAKAAGLLGFLVAEELGDSSLPSYWTVSGTALGRDTGRARSRRPKRWRMFRHYGYAAQSMWFRGGLRPGSYATHALGRPMSGFTAQDQLALKHRLPPDAYYNVFVPPDHPVIGPDPVRRVEDDERKIFRNGGGVEFQFPTGTPPGTVRGPYPIPPGRPIPFRPE